MPLLHDLHLYSVAALEFWYLPASHEVQALASAEDAYFPTPHVTHSYLAAAARLW